MGTIIVSVVLAAVIGLAIYGTIRKIKYGSSCCGGKDPMPARVKVKDKNKSHYPYTYRLKIDGMHCSGCVRKLENAFHSEEGLWANVSLEKREVLLRSKSELESRRVGKIVAGAGFTLLSFEPTDKP
ncbi:MAG: cation transporter [Lachnospiraceae bacterium]|nr:cation transporter [Lachnospiraceae bacterium]